MHQLSSKRFQIFKLRRTSNISKAFATSLSLILAFTLSIYLFDFKPTTLFYVGTILVMIGISKHDLISASFLYSFASTLTGVMIPWMKKEKSI